jgi:protein-L-isoaspartate(D-aspartate) O-methyltransferase
VKWFAAAACWWKRLSAVSSEEKLRRQMVETQCRARGIKDPRVLSALLDIPRHEFLPQLPLEEAYADRPVPIGHGQTISQPYIVALMTELLALERNAKVLEVGTGSGYQAAILSKIAWEVYSLEIVPELGGKAGATLQRLGIRNAHLKSGDGYEGWPEEAPFDGIILTAAPEQIPAPLLDQLAPEGRLVAPEGPPQAQRLFLIKRTGDGFQREALTPVKFVPMTGQAEGKT